MAVSYKRLWKLLVDKEMSKSDLRKKAEIAPNTMTKLRRDEEVSLTILSKICKTLHADFGDIVEYVPDAEIWDLYDENRKLIGRDHVRGEQLPIDGYHLVVHVWIRNSKGEYLISQRSANRPTYPLMWECVGGSVVKGEDSLLGAIREAKEEVGVDLMPENGQVFFTKTRKIIEGKIFNDIMDVWLFEYDGEVDLGNATTDEVAQVAWMNREQRFGVAHKEKIKQYKTNVDVLTLTATPIPRTLQMSLVGIRSLSLIETPPMNRYPVQTYVIEENKQILKDAIYKELSRNVFK